MNFEIDQRPDYNSIFSPYSGPLVAGGNASLGDLGGTRFFGLLMGQNQHALVAFDSLFKLLQAEGTPVCQLVELGTSHGGMSVFLQLYALVSGMKFVTYDYVDFVPTYLRLFELMNIDYRQADVLYDQSTIGQIGQLLSSPGTSVLLCDNGDKPLEFAIYARFLKPGDIIMAHDYSVDEQTYEQYQKGKNWSFYEVSEGDIRKPCREYRLKPFLEDIFLPAAWACRRKEA